MTTKMDRRCAIITGGASGIGRALAGELSGKGIHIVIADRQVELAGQAASAIRANGGSAQVAELDVRNAEDFHDLVQGTAADCGRLDYLFNNAGIVVIGEAAGFDLADWEEVIDVNLQGVSNGIHAAYPLMKRQGYGHIINTASMAGLVPVPMIGASYVASKHGVVGLSQALRCEAARYGVNVSVICPGAVRTPAMEGKGRYGRMKMEPAVWAAITRKSSFITMEPVEFARRVLRSVERNRSIIIEPNSMRLLWAFYRCSPWLCMKLISAAQSRMETDLIKGMDNIP